MAGGYAADNPDKRRKLCFPYLHKRRSPRRTSRRVSPRSVVASSTAARPSARASASASSSATPSRRWPASRSPRAWSARPCSSASPSPKRSRSSASSSPSSSRVEEALMRIRKLLLTTLLAMGTLLLVPAAASAQEQQTATTTAGKLPEANEDCIKKLENPNKKIDDCQKAPSPILPAKNEIIWGSIAFVVLLAALYKFAWPSLKGGMDARTERIRADLDAADTAKADAETVLSEYM